MSLVAKPQLWVVAGPNGAGKSTLVRRYVRGRVPVVNPDDIAREIDPHHHGQPGTMLRAGRLSLQQRQTLLRAGKSFVLETTLTGRSELNFMKQARDRGYKLNLVYVGVRDIEQSRSRVAERTRSGGHPVPIADILRRFDRSMQNLPPAMRLSDRVLVLDNSGARERLLLRIENGRAGHVARRMPAWAEKAIAASLR